jgi:hypothetical protein
MENQEQINAGLLAEIAKLRAANEALKAAAPAPKTGIKVSAKGAVSVYGLGRWPVTLYASQWFSLLSKSDEIQKFLVENKASLAVKES